MDPHGYRTTGKKKKQIVTKRMTINLSASSYSAAEETGPEVIWAGHPPLGHNMGSCTRFSGCGVKPDVLQREIWHKKRLPRKRRS